MNKSSRIFITGASGMVGSAIVRNLDAKGFSNLVGSCHSRKIEDHGTLKVDMGPMDLRNQAEVSRFFKNCQPEYVFLAAAKVGEIHPTTRIRHSSCVPIWAAVQHHPWGLGKSCETSLAIIAFKFVKIKKQ